MATANDRFSTILDRFVSILADGLDIEAKRVRVAFTPDAQVAEYLSEEGVVVRVRSPAPDRNSGGDRHAYMVERILDVFVITQSNVDPGGRDDRAAKKHLNKEDAVMDALHSKRPEGCVECKLVPGGAEIVRQLETDSGINVSAMSYRLVYRAALTRPMT